MTKPKDTAQYRAKKQFFQRFLTIFGRKPVLEALQDPQLQVYRLHLADSNKQPGIVQQIEDLAQQRGIDVRYHNRAELSRISKNGRQDQGVALDIECSGLQEAEQWLNALPERFEMIAVDSVTNPQNLGMIIRSVCASPMNALLLPEKGCANLDALVIKASAGTLFKAPIVRCQNLAKTLADFAEQDCAIYGLDADAKRSISQFQPAQRSIYVLGNETDGLSPAVAKACTEMLKIPMRNGVESLNVGVTASLLAFRSVFT